jgi:hypothetical protein
MKRIDAIIIAVILVIAATAMFAMSAMRQAADADGLRAEIYEDGVLTRTLPLDGASDITVNTKWGYNRIVVEDGGVRVAEADCGGLTCVHSGARSLPGDMIACLPHRLVIKLQGGEAPYDAIAY